MEAGAAPKMLRRFLGLLAALLILKVTVATVLKYRDYAPPNFNSDFLRGREPYFFGSYAWAFYIHIASGPVALVLGLILISDRFRQRFRAWHRRLGRVQATVVLFLVAPSGLWMAYHAGAGPVAAVGFSALAIATGTCTALGWRAAIRRQLFRTSSLDVAKFLTALLGSRDPSDRRIGHRDGPSQCVDRSPGGVGVLGCPAGGL